MEDQQSPVTPELELQLETDTTSTTRHINSVDATAGQPIVARVLARRTELEALLAALPEDDISTQGDIYLALATINDLLTGDLEHVPSVVVVDMNRWLERNKHLAERVSAQSASVAI